MKFFSATFAFIGIIALVSSGPVSKTDANEGVGDDIKNFFDRKITFAFVNEITPVIAKQVHATFERVARQNLGGSLSQVITTQFDKYLNAQWPLEKVGFVNNYIIAPMKQRMSEFEAEWTAQANDFYSKISKGAEDVSVQGIKAGTKEYFATGEAHHEEPIAVNITHTGLYGWVQKKLEGIHANVVHDTTPLMHDYVFSLKDQVLDFVHVTIKEAMSKVVGDSVANNVFGKYIIESFAQNVSFLVGLASDTGLEEASKQAKIMNNKVLREELYRPFSFLSGDLAAINDSIKE